MKTKETGLIKVRGTVYLSFHMSSQTDNATDDVRPMLQTTDKETSQTSITCPPKWAWILARGVLEMRGSGRCGGCRGILMPNGPYRE